MSKGLTPFVGREHEVGLLHEGWTQATEGRGQVIVLRGEAGIGKSRLVQVFTESLAGEAYTRIEYHCSPYYQHTAFYPVVTSFRQLLQFRPEETVEERLHKLEALLGRAGLPLAESIPLWAALLSLPLPSRYPPLTLTPQLQRQKTLEDLLTWLLREAERQPVCMIVEDLHWVDASTAEWLSLLIDQVPTARIFLLLACRPEFPLPWAARAHLSQITLRRLSRQDVEAMVQRMTGGKALPAEVLNHLVDTTDGVPLFVEEFTKMVLESGLVKEQEGRYELAGPLPTLAIPVTLHDSLMARLDRLGPAKQVAQLGATIGREFSYALIQAVAPVEEEILQQGLAQLVEAELLSQRGLPPQARYVFKHALIQEAAYHSMLRRTRRQYHRRIARVLEERFPETCESHPETGSPSRLSGRNMGEGRSLLPAGWEKGVARSANREAVACFEQALVALQHFPENRETCEQAIDLRLDLRNAVRPSENNGGISDCLREAETLARP